MKRIPSLQGFKDKLKNRADSKNRADPPAGTQSARKTGEKPPKFSMTNLKKITGMSARGEPLAPPVVTISKKKKTKDSSSSSSSSEVGNIIPPNFSDQHAAVSLDTKTLFLKI